MSPNLNDIMEQMRERLKKVDPNNRKVVAVFQMKSGGIDWGELIKCCKKNNNL